jgi:antitoxin HicB
MRFSYPYRIERQSDSTLVEFPDVSGAVTETREHEDTQGLIRDCLVAALGAYISSKKEPPAPSAPRGRPCITLDIVTSAKLTLATAMAEQQVSNVELARRLSVNEKVIRRMLDPDHRCRIDRLENALDQLGLGLELRIHPIPKAPLQEKGSEPFIAP